MPFQITARICSREERLQQHQKQVSKSTKYCVIVNKTKESNNSTKILFNNCINTIIKLLHIPLHLSLKIYQYRGCWYSLSIYFVWQYSKGTVQLVKCIYMFYAYWYYFFTIAVIYGTASYGTFLHHGLSYWCNSWHIRLDALYMRVQQRNLIRQMGAYSARVCGRYLRYCLMSIFLLQWTHVGFETNDGVAR